MLLTYQEVLVSITRNTHNYSTCLPLNDRFRYAIVSPTPHRDLAHSQQNDGSRHHNEPAQDNQSRNPAHTTTGISGPRKNPSDYQLPHNDMKPREPKF